jgi:tetratricopeptide (TPR) repeat protein
MRTRRFAAAWTVAAGLLLLALAQPAMALRLFGDARSDALADMRKADGVMNRADVAYDGGNKDQALELYRKAAETFLRIGREFPNLEDGLARFRLAYCESQMALLAGSVTNAAPGLAAEPAVAVAAGNMDARGSNAVGRIGSAFAAGSIPSLTGPAAVAEEGAPVERARPGDIAQARALLKADRLDAAAELLIEMLRGAPQDRSARLLIALVRSRQGRYDEARVALDDLAAEKEDPGVLLALAAASLGGGRPEHALLALDKAIGANPRQPAAYLNMAWLLLAASPPDRAAAEANYRQAVRFGASRDWLIERRLGLE